MQNTVQYFRAPDVRTRIKRWAFSTFSFDRHFHLDYHIGLVVDGVQQQSAFGKTSLIGRGFCLYFRLMKCMMVPDMKTVNTR